MTISKKTAMRVVKMLKDPDVLDNLSNKELATWVQDIVHLHTGLAPVAPVRRTIQKEKR
jgi:hypothetical protein